MILKHASQREFDISVLEGLAKRYPRYASRAYREIDALKAGDAGESGAAHVLNREFGEAKRIGVLHDVRLDCGDGDHLQIDHLLIHRVQRSAWILETKNYTGTLHCDQHGDWCVYYGRTSKAVPSPIEQAKRQVIGFERWMKRNNIGGIDRVTPVVLTNPRSKVNRKHLRPDDHIVKSDNVGRWFDEQWDKIKLGAALKMLGQYAVNPLSEDGLRSLADRISEHHEPLVLDWKARLGINGPRKESEHRPGGDSEGPAPIVDTIQSSFGDIIVRKVGIEFAVRGPSNPDLIPLMKRACKGRGRWNPRYKNWLVSEANIRMVVEDLRSSLNRL